jgi:hypothetical protein
VLELQTRLDLQTVENQHLQVERDQLVLDLEEVEGNIEKMAKDLKEQDYDFMEVLDENEEIENLYDELTRERERDAMIIGEQREVILRQQEEMRAFMEEKELVIKEKED